MDALIKNPAIARRLRGLGSCYVLDAGPTEIVIRNARHFKGKGLDFDALCLNGRISIAMDVHGHSNRLQREFVRREMRRQERLNRMAKEICDQVLGEEVTEESPETRAA